MLDPLGLSAQGELVYRAMLHNPSLNVTGLADQLEITVDEVRAALDVLADLALVHLDPAGQGVHVVRPRAGLGALLAKVEADIAQRQRQIEATRAAIAAIATAHDEHDHTTEGHRFDGLHAVRERLAELAGAAQHECLSFSTGGAQSRDTIEAEKPLNQLALARGVQIRNVYQDSFRNDPATLAYARWMADLGGQSRTAPTLPMRMVIIDRATALVPLDPASASDGALELHSPGTITGLVALFEQVWQAATPFGDQCRRDMHGLNPQECELIRLLAAGHTDESAARKLAISVRSVQRMMTSLTERLGATSRFQAGVHANQRGWI